MRDWTLVINGASIGFAFGGLFVFILFDKTLKETREIYEQALDRRSKEIKELWQYIYKVYEYLKNEEKDEADWWKK